MWITLDPQDLKLHTMQKINIILAPDQHIYFTSDMHFGHRNVIRFCNRPFADEKEMAQGLIKNWNDKVKPNDFVFSLGDFSWFTGRHQVKKLIEQLHGKKYLVPGNHCKEGMYELVDDPNFHECSDTVVLYVRGQEGDPRFADKKVYEIVLNHYPLSCYSHSDYENCYQFFGHIHSQSGTPLTEFGKEIPIKTGKQMDVGTDRWGYAPIDLFDAIRAAKVYPINILTAEDFK